MKTLMVSYGLLKYDDQAQTGSPVKEEVPQSTNPDHVAKFAIENMARVQKYEETPLEELSSITRG